MNTTVKISKSALEHFSQTCGIMVPETGGIFLADKEGVIAEFVFDRNGKCSDCGYVPDNEALNIILVQKEQQGVIYCGSGHSHPNCCATYPSGRYSRSIGDMASAKLNLECNPELDRFIMFICHSSCGGKEFEYEAYVIFRDEPEIPVKATVVVTDDGVSSRQTTLGTCVCSRRTATKRVISDNSQ
ncbi:MAG: hypothetical protein LBD80_07675 [Tannerella sp.]|jgi:hypothetical protein|nr:hypothetical protein [Tannerella sp.]